MTTIPFIDVQAQRSRLGQRIEQAIGRVLDHGKLILGPEVRDLETALSAFSGAVHTVTCANGTDAITLALMAEDIGRGDVVFVPAFTVVASAEAAARLGAMPYFTDVDEQTFTMDPDSLEAAIIDARRRGLRASAVIAVDLFGQPADYATLKEIVLEHDLVLIADAAQSFGGAVGAARVGTLADYTTTSFSPAKPLGCYGDGGAVMTDDQDKAAQLRSLRAHGKGMHRYDNVRVGLNSRLDTLQAAILLEKLEIFEDELDRRQVIAERYSHLLEEVAIVPTLRSGCRSAWAKYTLRHPDRDALIQDLDNQGVSSAVYYPIPLYRQTAYRDFPTVPGGMPVTERLAAEVVSLPIHPYLSPECQDRIVDAVMRSSRRAEALAS